MTLRDDIADLVADCPYKHAAPALRMSTIVSAKGTTYWDGPGRPRFESELREDDVPPDRVDEVLLTVDAWAGPDLDAILAGPEVSRGGSVRQPLKVWPQEGQKRAATSTSVEQTGHLMNPGEGAGEVGAADTGRGPEAKLAPVLIRWVLASSLDVEPGQSQPSC